MEVTQEEEAPKGEDGVAGSPSLFPPVGEVPQHPAQHLAAISHRHSSRALER